MNKEMKQSDLKVGDKVTYVPKHIGDRIENGIVKEIPEHTTTSVRVVYNCAGYWDDYQNYTSALTDLSDLQIGWK
jgi:hypothetical protein